VGLVVTIVLAGVLAGGYWFYSLTRDLPSLEAFENLRLTATSTLYDRDGSPLATISSVEDGRAISRSLVKLSDVSPAAAAAVVFSEDRRFFQHYGIDFIRLVGALYNVFLGDLQGGSTITTQVVKNTLLRELASQRALIRKAKEFPLALELERRYSKEEILEMYLNVSFWGGSLTGIQAASQAYFAKNPASLSLAEGAYLAVLIPGPNPRYRDLEGTRVRMKRLLDAMVAEKWVSAAEAEAAWKTPLVPRGWQARYDTEGNLLAAELTDPEVRNINELNVNLAPYFVLEVKRFLVRELGREKVFGQGGLKVYTTLDQRMQAAAEAAAADAAGTLPQKAQLALTALDPQSGEVLAMLGANHATLDEYNRATRLTRSPGSSVKPFVYALAIQQLGWTQATTVPDAPVEYPDKSQPGGVWRPKNFSGTFLNKPVTLRYALDRSLNLPAIRTAEQLGPATLAQHLKQAGFTINGAPSLSNSIGGGLGVSPTQLSAAYAAFVNGGYRVEPVMVIRVEDAEGQILYQAPPAQATRVVLYTPQVAYLGWDMLKGYIYDLGTSSLARRAAIPGRIVGGKTGTTDYAVDLWFAGASRGLVTALWIGRDDNKPMKLANGAEPSSSLINPPIFKNFAEKALRGRLANDFVPPPQLYPQQLDLLGGTPGGGTRMLFAGNAPTPVSPDGQPATTNPPIPGGAIQTVPLDRITGCLATEQTPPDRIVWQQIESDQIDNFRCID
jgi:penicillin-binding protein 1A